MGDTKGLLASLPPWARRLSKWFLWLGSIGGTLTALTLGGFDIYGKYSSVKKQTEAGYETLAPAIAEIQEILDEEQEWAEDTTGELAALKRQNLDQEKRIIRLEAYVEMLSSRNWLPDAPPEPDAVTVIEDGPMSVSSNYEPDVRPPPAKKTKRPVPTDIKKAKAYQQQRVQLKCPKDDPLCGAELE